MTVPELNLHPLNVAAKRRLLRERLADNPHRLHLLQWGLSNLDSEDDPRGLTLAAYDLGPDAQQHALNLLELELEPADVEELSPSSLLESLHLSLSKPPARD